VQLKQFQILAPIFSLCAKSKFGCARIGHFGSIIDANLSVTLLNEGRWSGRAFQQSSMSSIKAFGAVLTILGRRCCSIMARRMLISFTCDSTTVTLPSDWSGSIVTESPPLAFMSVRSFGLEPSCSFDRTFLDVTKYSLFSSKGQLGNSR